MGWKWRCTVLLQVVVRHGCFVWCRQRSNEFQNQQGVDPVIHPFNQAPRRAASLAAYSDELVAWSGPVKTTLGAQSVRQFGKVRTISHNPLAELAGAGTAPAPTNTLVVEVHTNGQINNAKCKSNGRHGDTKG